LDGEFAFDAADGFLDIVRDWLRKSPEYAWDFFEFLIHCRNQFLLVLVESRTPLLFGFETDEIFCVEETGRVGSVIGTARLAGSRCCFWKRAEKNPGPIHQSYTFRRTGTWSQRPANPDRTLIQMRQKFRSNHAEYEVSACTNGKNRYSYHDRSVVDRPTH